MSTTRTAVSALCLLAFVLAASLPAACAEDGTGRNLLATNMTMMPKNATSSKGMSPMWSGKKTMSPMGSSNKTMSPTLSGNKTMSGTKSSNTTKPVVKSDAGRHLLATRALMQRTSRNFSAQVLPRPVNMTMPIKNLSTWNMTKPANMAKPVTGAPKRSLLLSLARNPTSPPPAKASSNITSPPPPTGKNATSNSTTTPSPKAAPKRSLLELLAAAVNGEH